MLTLFAADLGGAAIIVSVGITVFVLIVLLVVMLIFAQYFRWWIQSLLTGAGITLWEKMGKVGKGQPPQWMSTHPSHTTRIDTIKKNLDKVMPFYEQAVASKR